MDPAAAPHIAPPTEGDAPEAARVSPPAPRTNAIPRVTSEELLGPCRQLVIAHDGRDYRLRITQNGKLILTA